MDGCQEAVHFLNGIRHEDRLEVVTILQSATDTCCDGVYVLQNRRVFDADDIARSLGLDEFTRQTIVGEGTRLFGIATAHGEIAQSLQCHLLGMKSTADSGSVLVRHIVHLLEIL